MKKELLVPAGDMECLKYAVKAGCDAVYLGGKKFGARKFASNFSNEELENAVKYCHLYGVKLYITVNTIIYENEIDECLNYIEFLGKIGVDALIVQDVGLIRLIKNRYPNIEVHASTQMHSYDEKQFEILESLGVERVVLAREMSLDEIKSINSTLEKEVFIHGAICISYSGQCLFSSLIMNRSGNRGECAGMCRLPYRLVDKDGNVINTEGEYLLSPKELSTIDRFKELMESDITSFKIEGRMKSKEYVYLVTKIYRTLMDKYYNNEDMVIDEELYNNLKIVYNREFTNGFLFKENDKNFMNIKTPNHIGVKIGDVIKVSNKKIYIKLTDDLYQEDGIRFTISNKGMIANFIYNEKDNLINSAKCGDIISLDNKIGLNESSEVLKTSSNYLNKEISLIEDKKINISYYVKAKLNQELEITIKDNENKITVKGKKIEEAINNITTKEIIIDKLNRLGDTPFKMENIDILSDNNIFIPVSEINNLRRELTDKLISKRQNKKYDLIINNNKMEEIKRESYEKKLSVSVTNEEQLKICLENINGDIYISDRDLYLKYQDNKNVYYKVDRLNKQIINYENTIIPDLSNLLKVNSKKIVTDYYLNVVNKSYIDYLFSKNIDKVTLSVECNYNNIKSLLDKYDYIPNIEILIYGNIDLMLMKHCIVNNLVNKDVNKCNMCKDNVYYLVDRNNKKYEIKSKCMKSRIMSYDKELYKLEEIKDLIKLGINNFRIDLNDENENETLQIIKRYKNVLQLD